MRRTFRQLIFADNQQLQTNLKSAVILSTVISYFSQLFYHFKSLGLYLGLYRISDYNYSAEYES